MAADNRRHAGFAGQQVQEAAAESGFEGVANNGGVFSLAYDELIPTVVKAIQEVSSTTISGTGRPDIPTSMSTDVQSVVASSPVGAVYTSIDGAGIGAFSWIKTASGWKCTYSDSGWYDLTALLPVELFGSNTTRHLQARRIGDVITYRFRYLKGTTGAVKFDLPPEWQQDAKLAAAGVLIPTDPGAISGKMQFGTTGGMEWKPTGAGEGFGVFTATAKNPLPTSYSGTKI